MQEYGKPYNVWIEIQANKKTVTDSEKFLNVMQKCRDAGVTGVIMSVKDTTGFTLWPSRFAPHYSWYDDRTFRDVDYVKRAVDTVHGLGMKFYAAVDVFAEGNKNRKSELMAGIRNPDWQTDVCGMGDDGEMKIQPVTDTTPLKTLGNIDDFGEIFVNPLNAEVRSHEIDLITELIKNYDIDGVVLDRVRYVGLSSDFGQLTRESWEADTGIKDEKWPEDIYTIARKPDGTYGINAGRYFGQFLTFRAGVIESFIGELRKAVDGCGKNVKLIDYTGSWYPLYYEVGANWASGRYLPEEYEWVDKGAYAKTGYLAYIDCLLSGFYYEDVTKKEAEEHKKPAYWYSVEGSADMAYKVTMHEKPVLGSLFLQQYSDIPENMTRAVKMCMDISEGCMLFDLSYIVDNDWWDYISLKNL